MPDFAVIRFDQQQSLDPGTGVVSKLLVHDKLGSNDLTNGISTFAAGAAIAPHWHNCDESVVLLAGEGVAEVDGRVFTMRQYDTTFVPAGVPHRFSNPGAVPMTILWIYAAGVVTRTFAATGLTVDHLDIAAGGQR